jgi:hypothetical protein
VFAAGDVSSGSIKRIASAVGEGSMAVRLVHERLAGRDAGTGPGLATAEGGPWISVVPDVEGAAQL